MMGIVHIETGELRVFDNLLFPQLYNNTPDGYALVTVPAGYPDTVEWRREARNFGPLVAALDAQGVYDLFTPAEKAAILTCGIGEVTGLVMALRWMEGLIRADSTFHQQGVALLLGLGLLTPERAAQVLVMEPHP